MSNSHNITIQKVEADEDSLESWYVNADEPDILSVSLNQSDEDEFAWDIFIAVAEFVREEPLESNFRKKIHDALNSVSGVKEVEEEDREVWIVDGNPNGEDLANAIVLVLTELYPDFKKMFDEF